MPAPAVGAALVAGGASLVGGLFGNRQARSESRRNRQFQERMRNTAWQAAVADMEAAGINPALAYQQGPAASPGGSMASQQDPFTPAVSTAMQARRLREEVQLIEAQVSKAKAEAAVAEDQKWWSAMRREYFDQDKATGRIAGGPSGRDIAERNLQGLLDAEFNRQLFETQRVQGLANVAGLGGSVAGEFGKMIGPLGRVMDVSSQGAGQLAGVIDMLERGARMRDDAVRAAFGVSKDTLEGILNTFRRANAKIRSRFRR